MGCPILYDYQSMVTGICDVRLSQRKRLGMWKALCRTSKEPVHRKQVTSPYASVRPYQRDVTRALVAKGLTHLCLRLCPAGVGFEKIYGYTSDQDGIRHAILDESKTVEPEDALFMLVSCSAFCNYLQQKAVKAGII